MKKLQILALSILIATGLSAQGQADTNTHTFEWLLGMGKVNEVEDGKFIYFLPNSSNYESEYITDVGIELKSRFSSNWTFNNKHGVLVGLDINLWSRRSFVTGGDVVSNWREQTGNRTTGLQTDLIIGYRYFIFMKQGKGLFIENVIHSKLHSGKYPGNQYSTEPGIGASLKLNENYNFISMLSFKQPIGNFTYDELYKNCFGFKLGLSRVL